MKKIIQTRKKTTTKPPYQKPVPGNNLLGRGATSVVHYDPFTKIVRKRIIAMLKHTTFARELYWLQYLNEKEYMWCPRLLGSDAKTNTIYMEHVGSPITKANAPADWKQQLQTILADLAKENIKHNDIKRSEVLVKDGKLHLIDYGWASRGNDWSCGRGFNASAKPCHVFHDNTAIERIAKTLS